MNWKFWKNTEKRELNYVNPNTFGTGITAINFSNDIAATSLSSIFAAIELISNSIAELPIYVKQHKDGNKTDIIDNHPIYLALDNNIMTRFMIIKSLVSDMLLYGNGICYIKRAADGTPIEIIYLPNGKYQIVYDKKRNQNYYICPEISNKKIEAVNMIHLMKNTKDGLTGVGVLKYAAQTIKLSNYTEKSATSFFASGCHVGGILSTDATRLTEQQRQQIKESWMQAHGGDNPNGIAVLENGMKYQPVTINSRDAQLLETRLYNLQEIARFFNINPALLGDNTKSSYSTLEAANMEFLTHTLMPIITLIQQEFKRKLLLPSESTLYIDLDENYLIRPDKVSQANYLTTLVNSGIISINEARRQLGMNPIEKGDEHLIPYTNLDQNNVSNITNTLEEENGEEQNGN